MITVFEQTIVRVGDSISITLPGDWEGGTDGQVQIILDDVCIIVPHNIANATGEVLVLRLLEGMIDAGIIQADDVQKAMEHLV